MIYPVTGWFEITQYDEKIAISIANLVYTTWLTRYPRPMEIIYYQGSEFIGHDLIKYLIEEGYRITSKPSTSDNPTSNTILERIHQFLGNLVRIFKINETYAEKDDPYSVVLEASAFAIFSTTNCLKGYSPVQLLF